MNDNFFRERLSKLRIQKDLSARNLSLSLGQSESYINKIENGKAYPSMQIFFYICDYLNITPKDFFSENKDYPALIQDILDMLVDLDEQQLLTVKAVVSSLRKK